MPVLLIVLSIVGVLLLLKGWMLLGACVLGIIILLLLLKGSVDLKPPPGYGEDGWLDNYSKAVEYKYQTRFFRWLDRMSRKIGW